MVREIGFTLMGFLSSLTTELFAVRFCRRVRCKEFPPNETRDRLVKGEELGRARDLLWIEMELRLGDLLGVLNAATLNEYFSFTAGLMVLHFISPSVSSSTLLLLRLVWLAFTSVTSSI